jgi:GT2 family glycosyltransferase/membrane protease YdiL (CAAX protease family)
MEGATSALRPRLAAGSEARVRREVVVPLLAGALVLGAQLGLIRRGHILAGQIVDATLVFAILNAAGTLRSSHTAAAMRGLALVALIPVIAAGLPLWHRSNPAAILFVAVPVAVAALTIAPTAGVPRLALIRADRLVLQLVAVLTGAALGLVAYLVGSPALWTHGSHRLASAIAAAAMVGVAEELVFRGVLQPALDRAIGRTGVLLATGLFASTVVGAGPTALVLTLVLAGVVFALAVVQTRAPGGAIAGHIALSVGALVAWPAALGARHPGWLAHQATTPVLACLVAVATAALVLSPGARAGRPSPARRLKRASRGRAIQRRPAHSEIRSRPPSETVSPSPAGVAQAVQTGPTISVIVCTYSEARWAQLGSAVDSVGQQRRAPEETLLVVDHNDALLARAKAAFPNARVLANDHARGLSGARNTGVRHSHGDVLAFLDDDAYAEPGWLEALLDALSQPGVMGAGGVARAVWESTPPAWMPPEFLWVVGASYKGLPRKRAPVRNPIGANMAFRREAFERLGGFTDGIGRVGRIPVGCEETEFSIRLRQELPGAVVLYVPDAVVNHRISTDRTTWRYFLSRCWAEGVSKSIVTAHVGRADALASERWYVRRTLPLGVMAGVRAAARGERGGLARAGAILAGLAVTGAGFARGRLAAQSRHD